MQHFCLRGVIEGRYVSLRLAPGSHRLGSLPACDLMLAGSGVSRRHAALEVRPEQVSVRDLGSKNGTFVNGRRIRSASLAVGDELELGDLQLRLELLAAGDAELALSLVSTAGVATATRWAPARETTRLDAASGPRPRGIRRWIDSRLVFPEGYVPGESPAMVALHAQMTALVEGDLPVLIVGDTGVGKEYSARVLHLSSPRRDRPFIAINCAAIPADLLEAELFGIEKGVATGVQARAGKFRDAEGGILFLDEIGDMSSALQAKLLRALQEREIQPVGGQVATADVRIISATNVDLSRRIAAGSFRSDLYYRLAGTTLQLPRLRQRRQDIPPLVESFVCRALAETGKSISGVTVKALSALTEYSWPGNVRELEHEVRRLVYSCPAGHPIDSSMLDSRIVSSLEAPNSDSGSAQDSSPEGTPTHSPVEAARHPPVLPAERLEELNLAALEKRAIEQALAESDGVLTHAASRLGISRDALRRRLVRHGLRSGRDPVDST